MTPTEHDPIADALRRPAPDEPASIPPLPIDEVGATRVRPGGVRHRPAKPDTPWPAAAWPLVLVGVIVVAGVALQLVGIAGPSSTSTPAPLPSRQSEPSAAHEQLATFSDEISFDYPASWGPPVTSSIGTFGSPIAILGTVDLSACGTSVVDINCVSATRLKPGDVFVYLGTVVSPNDGSILDLAPPGGFTDFIDGMPAVANSTGPNPRNGADAEHGWQFARPGTINQWYTVSGQFRGPGIDQLSEQFDALVRSIRFDQPTPSLPTDPASIDSLVAKAVDALDRNARVYSSYYGCFPRRVGSSVPTVIADGPSGPWGGPIQVTCTVSMQAEPVGVFAMTLAASWEAGPGYAEGTYRQVVLVSADGGLGAMQSFSQPIFPPMKPKMSRNP